MIGNKVDLEEERQVTTDAGEEFARENEVFFMEVSALENGNDCVNKAFRLLVEGECLSLIESQTMGYFTIFRSSANFTKFREICWNKKLNLAKTENLRWSV